MKKSHSKYFVLTWEVNACGLERCTIVVRWSVGLLSGDDRMSLFLVEHQWLADAATCLARSGSVQRSLERLCPAESFSNSVLPDLAPSLFSLTDVN